MGFVIMMRGSKKPIPRPVVIQWLYLYGISCDPVVAAGTACTAYKVVELTEDISKINISDELGRGMAV